MLTLTPKAQEVIRQNIREENLPPTTALRVGITREGCEESGTEFRYVIAVDPRLPGKSDQVFVSEGVTLYVDRESLPHVDGLTLDVLQDVAGTKFVFNNPNAKRGCGCGQTFST